MINNRWYMELTKEAQSDHDVQMRKDGFKKIRQNLSGSRYAIRYLPAGYRLRDDEELINDADWHIPKHKASIDYKFKRSAQRYWPNT